jgi:tetratricopeptide (TPR) repeat protein
VGVSFYSLSQKNATELIKEAKDYISQGDKEKAISALDLAFKTANSAGDVAALMEIGDLYISIDKSLEDKAMKAWSQAGRWKCK